MQQLQVFQFELIPDGQQQCGMPRFAGSCRLVYNKTLALQKQNHDGGNKFIGYVPMATNLPIWKRELGQEWIKDAPSQALQHALKDLEKTYKNFFAKRADFPKFERKGNGEQHVKMVKQKSGLNRAILDRGWGEFRRQLGYKVAWNGGMLLAVPPRNTSRTCPCCTYTSKDNRQTQATFLCVNCGYENHADVVGATNILARGHRVLDCKEKAQLGRSRKQEPTEATGKSSRSAVGIPVF